MNLHGIASAAVAAVNPMVPLLLQQSTGYTQVANGDGTQIPAYAAPITVMGQVQALDSGELRQVDRLNTGAVLRKVYLNGDWESLVRNAQKGGDLLTLPDGTVWLFVHVLEHWPDWTAAVIAEQNGS